MTYDISIDIYDRDNVKKYIEAHQWRTWNPMTEMYDGVFPTKAAAEKYSKEYNRLEVVGQFYDLVKKRNGKHGSSVHLVVMGLLVILMPLKMLQKKSHHHI